jgi:hypothetical protein
LLLFPSNSQAQNVCFDDKTAGAMVVALEKAKIAEEQLATQAGGNIELQNQVDILRGTIKLYEDQIVVYKNMSEMNTKMGDMKDKACAEQVKAVTPTFTQNMGKYSLGAVVGAILTGIALLVL